MRIQNSYLMLKCPYCKAAQNVSHDDGENYEENTLHQKKCKKCEKTFVFETFITFSYQSWEADCLNEGEHNYQLTYTFTHKCSKMRCSNCHEERELTNDELNKFNIKKNGN